MLPALSLAQSGMGMGGDEGRDLPRVGLVGGEGGGEGGGGRNAAKAGCRTSASRRFSSRIWCGEGTGSSSIARLDAISRGWVGWSRRRKKTSNERKFCEFAFAIKSERDLSKAGVGYLHVVMYVRPSPR